MRVLSRSVVTALGGLVLVLGASGCQYSYPFEISGVVRGAADGAPLTGVTATLQAGGIRESSFPVVTGPDGSVRASFRVADSQFMRGELPKWTLVLTKEGYEDQALDVSPTHTP